jgi:hypothetical protein
LPKPKENSAQNLAMSLKKLEEGSNTVYKPGTKSSKDSIRKGDYRPKFFMVMGQNPSIIQGP